MLPHHEKEVFAIKFLSSKGGSRRPAVPGPGNALSHSAGWRVCGGKVIGEGMEECGGADIR